MKKRMEIEFKYPASGLSLLKFKQFAENLGPISYKEAAGYDYYFTQDKCGDSFLRYRAGDCQQLTAKRKTADTNNYVREEPEIDLAHGQTFDKIQDFVRAMGYPRLNFSVFKACFIYYFKQFDMVYYVVYDEAMQEQGRFLELEALQSYPWESENHAWEALVALEKTCADLGINATIRHSKSLFEMYRKD